jgi:peptidyl-prolyl cis-trans isomerase D
MFDLFRSREKSVRILLGALLVVVGLSMLTYLIPSYNSGGSSSSDAIVAEVGGEPITLPQIQRIVQTQLRGRNMPPEVLPAYVPQLIDSVINEHALAYEAQKMGFEVTDAQIGDAIRTYIPNLFQDGKFVGKDAYAAVLAQQNLSIPEFESEMRRQLLITRLRDVAVQGVVVTPQEIEAEFKKRNDKIKIEYVKLTADKYRAESQPTQDDIQKYYDQNRAQFTQPEKRNLAVLIADQGKIEQSVNPTDADLQKMYTQNQASFRTPEEVKVRHILFMTQGKPPADDAKIKAQAEDVLKQVRSGANFAELAKKYSEDPGSKDKGGEYTVQKNGQMVPEFEAAAFRMKPGESEIVKTSYGYHVFQVVAHDQARMKPFDEVKAQLATEWKRQRVSDMMQQISDKAQAMLQKDPTHPEKVAADLNMQLVRADGIESGQPVPEVGVSPDFDQSIAGLKKGEVSQPVALPGNKIALAVVTDVVPPRPSTLAEAQEKIRAFILNSKSNNAVQTHARELIEKAKASGGDLAKVAKSMGLEVKTSSEFARNGAVEGVGSATYFGQAFLSPDGTILGPIGTPDGQVVAKLVGHVQADMAQFAAQRNQIRDELKTQKARDREALFEAGLRESLIQSGKIKVHKDVIDRLIASYRGA